MLAQYKLKKYPSPFVERLITQMLIVMLLGGGINILSVSDVFASEAQKDMEVSSKMFSLHLGATRIVYNPDSSGKTMTVINDQNYPMLVQSEVLAEDQKSRAPFMVTPPLFRLDGLQSSRLRIVRTGGTFPYDRESLQWLCIKGIPPKADDKWAEDRSGKQQADKMSLQVQFSVNSCIKMFIRPSSVKGHPEDAAKQVEWHKSGDKFKGINPTPFFINLSILRVGDKDVKERNYIAPFSSQEYDFPSGGVGKVQWQVVTDYGGKSRLFEAEFKE